MKRAILLLLLLAGAQQANQAEATFARLNDPDFGRNLIAFNLAFNSFIRTYLGCPTNARQLVDCNPQAGGTDLAAYRAAAADAVKVFPVKR